MRSPGLLRRCGLVPQQLGDVVFAALAGAGGAGAGDEAAPLSSDSLSHGGLDLREISNPDGDYRFSGHNLTRPSPSLRFFHGRGLRNRRHPHTGQNAQYSSPL